MIAVVEIIDFGISSVNIAVNNEDDIIIRYMFLCYNVKEDEEYYVTPDIEFAKHYTNYIKEMNKNEA